MICRWWWNRYSPPHPLHFTGGTKHPFCIHNCQGYQYSQDEPLIIQEKFPELEDSSLPGCAKLE